MTSAFPSLHAFFTMGGYAFYVWLAVLVAALTLGGLILQTHWQHRQMLKAIQRQHARKKRIQQAHKQPEGKPDADAT